MTGLPPHLPFAVPGIAPIRSNAKRVESLIAPADFAASSLSSLQRNDLGEGDLRSNDDDMTTSTASSSSSVESLVSSSYRDDDRQKQHRYPPRQSRESRHAEQTHGNGTYADDPTKGKGKAACSSDDEDDDNKELLDEEERVGMMMSDRDVSASARWWQSSVKETKQRGYLRSLLFTSAVALSILLFVPALKWLSTANSRAGLEEQQTSILSTKPQHLLEVAMPDYWRLPADASRPTSHIHKPKRPLAKGKTKLKEFGGPFALNFDVSLSAAPADAPKKQFTMDQVFDGTFSAQTGELSWCEEDPDEGVFYFIDGQGDIYVEDVTNLRRSRTGQGQVAKGGGKVLLARGSDMKMENGTRLQIEDFKISPDMQKLLIFTGSQKQWRYSRRSFLWIHDRQSKSTKQVGFNLKAPTIAVAYWSKKGYVSFVEGNNLHIIKDASSPSSVVSVTKDGAKEHFNGVADWVYEEEVLEGHTAHWWSPDGSRLVFMTFNETMVEEFSYSVYNPTSEAEHALIYPQQQKIKYPKAGRPNPTVSVSVYDVNLSKTFELEHASTPVNKTTLPPEISSADFAMRSAGHNKIVSEIKWLNDSTLILRETNRVSDAMRWISYDCSNPTGDAIPGKLGRRLSTTASGGWIPANQDVRRIGSSASSTAYVDLVAEAHGYRHVAYYANSSQVMPTYLTSGDWEVDKILFVGNGKVYFSAAYPLPSLRHILYVNIPSEKTPLQDIAPTTHPSGLTNVQENAWYDADFDPKGGYYQLMYQGPHVPWTKVLSLRDKSFELTLEDNAMLKNRLAKYVQPQRVFYNVTTDDGIVLSVQEIRPHDFDGTGATRYPALLKVYGGPDSQVVQARWSMAEWSSYLACTLGYIVVLVDGRGTGFRGRDYRDVVTWRLGDAEATDVIGAAQEIRRLPYIAQSKVGIWGWSFGGYLTAKIIEQDSGAFDLGMSVAPVTRWEFYDSVYTERYMKTPHLNKYGYTRSAVHVTKGFENSHFLLAQGSGDDNVHYQNSAHLLDMLTQQRIRGFWFRMFTDSKHSINTRGANRELYEFMTRFLVYNWGAGGLRHFHYANDKTDIQKRGSEERAKDSL